MTCLAYNEGQTFWVDILWLIDGSAGEDWKPPAPDQSQFSKKSLVEFFGFAGLMWDDQIIQFVLT